MIKNARQYRLTRSQLDQFRAALEEAEGAARWYADRSTTAALAFSDEIEAAESAIVQRPDAWPPFDHGTRRFLLRRFPFSIVYRVEEYRIVIVAVAHAHRRPGYWESRLPG